MGMKNVVPMVPKAIELLQMTFAWFLPEYRLFTQYLLSFPAF